MRSLLNLWKVSLENNIEMKTKKARKFRAFFVLNDFIFLYNN